MLAPGNSNVQVYPKLQEAAGFANWKFRVKILLEERNLIEVLEEKEKDDVKWKEKDARARSIIVQCLSDKFLEIVKKCLTAHSMFCQLEKIFERKSVFNKIYLRKKLLSLKYDLSTPLQDHFIKFNEIVYELEGTSTKLEDSDKICHLLLTMPNEYENVITAIETLTDEREIDIDFVKARLLDAELKLKEKRNNNESSFASFVCYKCGKEGHKFYQCNSINQRGGQTYRGRGKQRGGRQQSSRGRIQRWSRIR